MAASNTTNTLKDGTKKESDITHVVILETKVQKFVQPIVLEQMY